LPLSACYSIIPPLFVCLNLNNIVRHWYLETRMSFTI
jgi:hypothetical protein